MSTAEISVLSVIILRTFCIYTNPWWSADLLLSITSLELISLHLTLLH